MFLFKMGFRNVGLNFNISAISIISCEEDCYDISSMYYAIHAYRTSGFLHYYRILSMPVLPRMYFYCDFDI